MKISLDRDALLTQLQAVTRVASTRSAIQALSGVQLAASGSRLRAPRDRHRRQPPRPARGRGHTRGHRRAPGAPAARRRPLAAAARASRSSCAPPSRTSRCSPATPPSTSARCTPRTSRPSPSPTRRRPSRCPLKAFVETALKVSGSASRDETRPVLTGILVSASGSEVRMVATDSYRLSVKETTLETPLRRRIRGQRAGARAPGAGAPRRPRRGREPHDQRAPEPGRLRARRGRALLAPDRRPVPQLPPAAARGVRARAADRRPRAARRRAPHQPAGAEERAAAARRSRPAS